MKRKTFESDIFHRRSHHNLIIGQGRDPNKNRDGKLFPIGGAPTEGEGRVVSKSIKEKLFRTLPQLVGKRRLNCYPSEQRRT